MYWIDTLGKESIYCLAIWAFPLNLTQQQVHQGLNENT